MNMIFTFIDIKIELLYELLQKVIKGVDTEHVAICFWCFLFSSFKPHRIKNKTKQKKTKKQKTKKKTQKTKTL